MNLAFKAQFLNLTNSPVFSVPASWWGQYSSCASCSGVRTTGVNGGGSGTTGLFGLPDGSKPGPSDRAFDEAELLTVRGKQLGI